MYYKIILIILTPLLVGMILVDKIAATINDEIITVSDIEKSLFFYPLLQTGTESEDELYSKHLKNLINYKIVYLEYKDQFHLADPDFEDIRTRMIRRHGSLEKFKKILRNFDMNISDFMKFVKEKVLFDKVIKERFRFSIDIPVDRIRDYYNKKYVPSQKSLGVEPRTMIEVAPAIGNYLRLKKIDRRLSEWLNELKKSYKIRTLLKVT